MQMDCEEVLRMRKVEFIQCNIKNVSVFKRENDKRRSLRGY